MTVKLGTKLTTFKRIVYNLWILASFIPMVNGMGIIYVGAKTSNKSAINEGLIMEIPWMLLFLAYGIIVSTIPTPYMYGILGIIAIFIIISIISSIVRSFSISPKYERLLEEGRYKKSNNKLVSFGWLIITCIPFFNGIPFIYSGAKHSKNSLKIEGSIYEIPWILFIITAAIDTLSTNLASISQFRELFRLNAFLTPFFMGLAVALQIISIARFIIMNYKSDFLSSVFGTSFTESNEEDSETSKKEEDSVIEVEPVTVEPTYETYDNYRETINDLTKNYEEKEDRVCELINERFKKSLLTHERFMRIINNSHENFYSQREIALNIIELSSEDMVLKDKIKQKISYLELIISKMRDLQTELIINNVEDKNSDENISELIDDMEVLTGSVKDYE